MHGSADQGGRVCLLSYGLVHGREADGRFAVIQVGCEQTRVVRRLPDGTAEPGDGVLVPTADVSDVRATYLVPPGQRRTITLPLELCRNLGVEAAPDARDSRGGRRIPGAAVGRSTAIAAESRRSARGDHPREPSRRGRYRSSHRARGTLMATAFVPDRGQIVWIDMNPQSGHEQAGRRPAVVLSPAVLQWADRAGLDLSDHQPGQGLPVRGRAACRTCRWRGLFWRIRSRVWTGELGGRSGSRPRRPQTLETILQRLGRLL